jgi:hypothetical protein
MALQSTTALATVTLQAATPTVTFSGIPNTYRDLILVANFNGTTTGQTAYLNINGSFSGSMVGMRGNGSAVASYTQASMFLSYAGGFTSTFETAVANILDYAQTDKHKTILVRADNATSKAEAMANRWASLDPITSVGVSLGGGNIVAGSTFSLYGRIA